MSPEATEEHLSIGEVLAQLHDEFPEVTISKIRFLESQGLIDPQRTPSGYRRFFVPDVERLRWILFQQREFFLPLRVIKERLDEFGPLGAPPLQSANGDRPAGGTPSLGTTPATRHSRAGLGARAQSSSRSRRVPTLPLEFTAMDADDAPGAPPLDSDEERDRTRAELLDDSGLHEDELADLEAFGLVAPASGAGDHARYGAETVEIARVAAHFSQRGITARHLRMYVHEAEREAGLFAQVLLPYRRQRNPTASARLAREREELMDLGRRLRALTLSRAMRGTVTE